MRFKITSCAILIATLVLVVGMLPTVSAGDARKPECDQMDWIWDLWSIGFFSDAGFRKPGSDADLIGVTYIQDRLTEFGIQDATIEPVSDWDYWDPNWYSLTVEIDLGWGFVIDLPLPCSFRPYTAFTGQDGIEAELIYVNDGMDADDYIGAEGKIAVVDLEAAGLPANLLMMFSPFTYDPESTLPGTLMAANWPVDNEDSYEIALEHDCVGFIGILNFLADFRQSYYAPYRGEVLDLTGLYVSDFIGQVLKDLIAEDDVNATIKLRGDVDPGTSYNVWGTVPGQTDDIILVTTHHDGWAANDASGISIVLGLAQHYAQLPPQSRQKTLMFMCHGGHFIGDVPTYSFIENHPDVVDRVLIDLNIEQIGKDYQWDEGLLYDTGLAAARAMFISGPPWSVDPQLLGFAQNAITNNDLDRTMVLPAAGPFGATPPGRVAGAWFEAGKPIIHMITAPAHQFTPEDTPDKVMDTDLGTVTDTYIELIDQLDVEFP